jgi:hypothetical protein
MGAIRKLYASEIECRVAQCGKKGEGAWCSLLLYKDARVDMRILDEVYGPMNWQREHTIIGENLYCTIKIYDLEKGEWISKQDVGTESFTEKEKGQASDSFKRAGFNIGIGRELYTAPKIFINLDKGEWDDKGSKVVPKISFDVADIDYDNEGNICYLVIVDNKGREKYRFGKPNKKQSASPSLSAPKTDKPMMHRGHENWEKLLQSILDGKATLEAYKKKYFFPEADEIAAKEWLLTHQE